MKIFFKKLVLILEIPQVCLHKDKRCVMNQVKVIKL